MTATHDTTAHDTLAAWVDAIGTLGEHSAEMQSDGSVTVLHADGYVITVTPTLTVPHGIRYGARLYRTLADHTAGRPLAALVHRSHPGVAAAVLVEMAARETADR